MLLIDPVVARLRALFANTTALGSGGAVARRLIACHHPMATEDVEAAVADAFFADGQHIPDLLALAQLPRQVPHITHLQQAPRVLRVCCLLLTAGRGCADG